MIIKIYLWESAWYKGHNSKIKYIIMSSYIKISVFSNEKHTKAQGHRKARNKQNNKRKSQCLS